MANAQRCSSFTIMHLFLAALAVLFVVLGFSGFALGGLPTIVFWFLAAVCLVGAWKLRSTRQRAREDRAVPPAGS
jgi:uncharacterized membrane protein YbaN (DUF454 family)